MEGPYICSVSKPDQIFGSKYLMSIQTGPAIPMNEDVPEGPGTAKVLPVPIEEQEFQDFPDDDPDLEDNIAEFQQEGKVKNTFM